MSELLAYTADLEDEGGVLVFAESPEAAADCYGDGIDPEDFARRPDMDHVRRPNAVSAYVETRAAAKLAAGWWLECYWCFKSVYPDESPIPLGPNVFCCDDCRRAANRDRAARKAKAARLVATALEKWDGVSVRDVWSWRGIKEPVVFLGLPGSRYGQARWDGGETVTLQGEGAEAAWERVTGRPVKVIERRPMAVPEA